MTVPVDTTVTLYKGDEKSPRLHPIDIEAWVRLGWEERPDNISPPSAPAQTPTDATVILYKGDEKSPPLHPIDVATWTGLGWSETKTEEPKEVKMEPPKEEDVPKAEVETPRKRAAKPDSV